MITGINMMWLLVLLTWTLLLKLTGFGIVKIGLRKLRSLIVLLWDLLPNLLLKGRIFTCDEFIPSSFLRSKLFGVELIISRWKIIRLWRGYSAHDFRPWIILWKWTQNRSFIVISISWQMLLYNFLISSSWVSVTLVEYFLDLLKLMLEYEMEYLPCCQVEERVSTASLDLLEY